MRLTCLSQADDVVHGVRPAAGDEAGQGVAQIIEIVLQEGFEFGLEFRYRSWTIADQVEQLPLPAGQACFAQLAFELRVNETVQFETVQFLEPVTDRSIRTSVDHELAALPHKLIMVSLCTTANVWQAPSFPYDGHIDMVP